jgi:hypothetical protein
VRRKPCGASTCGGSPRGASPCRASPCGQDPLSVTGSPGPGTIWHRRLTGGGRSLAPCPLSLRSSGSYCRVGASPVARRGTGCAMAAGRACARSRRRCAPAAGRRPRSRSRPAGRAAACAGSRRRAPRSGSRGPRSRSSVAGSAARSRRGAWPPRSWCMSCPGRRSRRSPWCPRCGTVCCCAAPIRRRSSLQSWRAGGACRSCRSYAARTESARSAGSTPLRAAATCAARLRPARGHGQWRSSTTSTRRGRPWTNAPGRSAGRAPSVCTS